MQLVSFRDSLAISLAILAAVLVRLPVSAQEATPSPTAQFPPFSAVQSLPNAEARAGGPLKVVASTPIIADFVREVGGDRVQVASILPVNADPHDFEPKPDDIIRVED